MSGSTVANSLEQRLRSLLTEAYQHRRLLAVLFVVISLSMSVVGVFWPKVYTSSVTILVDNHNIIKPLLQGQAVPTGAVDQSRVARELLYSRSALHRIMQATGLLASHPTPVQQQRIAERIKRHTRVFQIGDNLVKIQYQDDRPGRARQTVSEFAQLFIEASLKLKSQESDTAYEFIDNQVDEYHKKLVGAENRMRDFRDTHLDARPGTEGTIGDRITTLQDKIQKTELELKEAHIKEGSLKNQLSGEAAVTASISREGQYQELIAQLQGKLATLRLSYKDSYPDIVQLRYQIADLKEAVRQEQKRRELAQKAAEASGKTYVDKNIQMSPLYERLRRELSDTRTSIATLRARRDETRKMLSDEVNRGKRVSSSEAVMAELTRDYHVNRDIYQDLLKRRENARISMNLDRDQQGMSLRVYEPAFLPLKPSGLRFIHFAAGGILLGLAVPFGLLLALQEVDPRIRSEEAVQRALGLPVVAVVPDLLIEGEVRRERGDSRWVAVLLFLSMGAFVAIGLLKMKGIL
ncbi:MAG TPA: XrtA system polysaccharide chain length determinant [Gammaproteobacteria bacterium]|nr:XrtA system polysaccharide chain length determinant [Gammaproteobacteria bacterium]